MVKYCLSLVTASLMGLSLPVHGATSLSYVLFARIPMNCHVTVGTKLSNEATGPLPIKIHEYCNAPRRFALHVRYPPEALGGSSIETAETRTILDASGTVILEREMGPRARDETLVVRPGKVGSDLGQMEFVLQPF